MVLWTPYLALLVMCGATKKRKQCAGYLEGVQEGAPWLLLQAHALREFSLLSFYGVQRCLSLCTYRFFSKLFSSDLNLYYLFILNLMYDDKKVFVVIP